MKRLCLIGNSHIAAVKLGWDRLRDRYPGLTLTFFGSRRPDSCRNLQLENGALVPTDEALRRSFAWTSGGAGDIRLGDYDGFLLIALQFAPQRVVDVAAQYSYLHPALDTAKRLVSRECFLDAVMDGLRSSIAAGITARLRKGTDRPVLIVAQPGRSEDILADPEFRASHAAADHPSWDVLAKVWTECALKEALRLDAGFVPQPGQTIRHHLFTARAYSKGSVRLTPGFSRAHGADDHAHMNADYGAAVIESVMARLA